MTCGGSAASERIMFGRRYFVDVDESDAATSIGIDVG